jgi:hypothetical protein
MFDSFPSRRTAPQGVGRTRRGVRRLARSLRRADPALTAARPASICIQSAFFFEEKAATSRHRPFRTVDRNLKIDPAL